MTLQPPSISNFKSKLNKGIQRPYRYFVMFSLPSGVANSQYNDIIPAFAYNVSLPSKQIETTEWRHLGKMRNMPTHVTYPAVQMTFLCDGEMKIKKMLDAWQAFICEPTSYYMNYYDNYARQSCVIMSLDDMGMPTYAVKLFEFWPRRVDEIRFSAQGTNEVATVEAEFVIRDWHSADTIVASGEDLPSALGIEIDTYASKLTSNAAQGTNIDASVRQMAETALNELASGLGVLKNPFTLESLGKLVKKGLTLL